MKNGFGLVFSALVVSALSLPAAASAAVSQFEESDSYTQVSSAELPSEYSVDGDIQVDDSSSSPVMQEAPVLDESQPFASDSPYPEQPAEPDAYPSPEPTQGFADSVPVDQFNADNAYEPSIEAKIETCNTQAACKKAKDVGEVLATQYIVKVQPFNYNHCSALRVDCLDVAPRLLPNDSTRDVEQRKAQVEQGCYLGVRETCLAENGKKR